MQGFKGKKKTLGFYGENLEVAGRVTIANLRKGKGIDLCQIPGSKGIDLHQISGSFKLFLFTNYLKLLSLYAVAVRTPMLHVIFSLLWS